MTPPHRRAVLLAVVLPSLAACSSLGSRGGGVGAIAAPGAPTFVYVGTNGAGIVIFDLDNTTGTLVKRGSSAVVGAVSALGGGQAGKILVATNKTTGSVVSLAIDPKSGALASRGRAAAGGSEPAGTVVDRTGKYALVANPSRASVAVLAIKPDGSLDAPDLFPAAAGAQGVAFHPSNEAAFVANQRAGTLQQFTFATGTGALTPKPGTTPGLPPGSRPRAVVCHPTGRWVYVLNEGSDTITVHAFDADSRGLSPLSLQSVSTLPRDAPAGKSRPVDLRVAPSGRFLYAINRGGYDSVVAFAVDGEAGTLTPVHGEPSGGEGPSALAVDPSGAFLLVANEGTRTVAVFRLDPKTGVPTLMTREKVGATPLSLFVVSPAAR